MNVRILLATLLLTACATQPPAATIAKMDQIANQYVRLVLAVGEHDGDYVDAYYGPPEIREEVKREKASLATIRERAEAAQQELAAVPPPSDNMLALRHSYLNKQLGAMIARIDFLSGRKMYFDEESRALYDAQSPHHDAAYYQAIVDQIDRELPGSGSTIERIEAFRKEFVIPRDRLDAVFREAINGCRARTIQHIELPAEESFTLEYVTNKSWSGYNWYQGGFKSLIQVNTDLPIFIDRAIDLACHEGYPGHHVYNVLLEKHLVRDRGWIEFSVYPLFSPQSLVAEGSANYGIDVAFPSNERVAYEKEVLFPLAGLDPSKAEKYYRLLELTSKLSYAGNDAARDYLDGKITKEQTVDWLVRYALMGPERARQRVSFMEKYRAYVINYNLGRDLVRDYVERHSLGLDQRRWDVFEKLLSSPRLPSDLAK